MMRYSILNERGHLEPTEDILAWGRWRQNRTEDAMNTKYPAVTLAKDWRAKINTTKLLAFSADEDEPMYQIPPVTGRWYPHRVAVMNGLVVLAEPAP